jgi:LCP family protein required for cell wall assembly
MRENGPNFVSPRRPRRVNTFVVLIVVGLALLVLPAAGFVALRVAGDLTQRMQQVVGGGNVNATPLAPLSLPDIGLWQGQDRITILLLGIDQRPEEDATTARTDTLIVLTLDPQTDTAGMMSIPRDLYVPLPDHGQDRINTAHVYGGTDLAKRTVEYNFGIPVQHYARVNFAALTSLIDLVGGVEIYNEQDINDQSYPDDNNGYAPFVLPAGWHTLDGATALKYARTRHGDSDFQRVRRQQQIIMALREKLRTTDAATKILPQLPQILQTLSGVVQTDLNTVEIAQLILLAKDIPDERIARVVLDETAVQPWTTPQGGSVLIPVRERVRELREQLFNPAIAQPAAPSAPSAPAEPGRIQIQNGTQQLGLAASAKAYLESKGFVVEGVADAPQAYQRTVIVDYKGKQQLMRQLANDLDVPLTSIATVPDPNNPLDALVILGDDYVPK